MSQDVLPDSRLHSNGTRKVVNRGQAGSYVQIYCANCGIPYGQVPEKMMTFAFALCQPCADGGHGKTAHFYEEPDAVFWERVANAQLEEHGCILSADQLAVQLDDPTTTLAKLADEWRAFVRKVG